ncbi:uncharacterized protein BKA78DRAFT_354031 [Phyllosticta capitalensis]|uniref:Uncharacterized protein n=1 Tax=Phyllosticta capitalensis TaxID=121624 RepID=A0ABR1YL40_9PEZI
MSSRHHHPYHPLSSHPPATSDTSLTHHHHAGYRVRRLGPESSGGKGKTKQRDAVLSGHGVKRAPPRAWDDWDAAALQRRNRRLLRPSSRPHGYSYPHQQHPLQHGSHTQRQQQHHYAHQHASAPSSHAHTTSSRARPNSSARRSHPRPLINVGHNHNHHHGSSFAARAAATPHAGLNDVLRAAMYQPDAADDDEDVGAKASATGFAALYARGKEVA